MKSSHLNEICNVINIRTSIYRKKYVFYLSFPINHQIIKNIIIVVIV